MRHTLFFLVSLICVAKPTTVPKSACINCHVGKPSEKRFNNDAKTMIEQYKESECADCHSVDKKGKLTIPVK